MKLIQGLGDLEEGCAGIDAEEALGSSTKKCQDDQAVDKTAEEKVLEQVNELQNGQAATGERLKNGAVEQKEGEVNGKELVEPAVEKAVEQKELLESATDECEMNDNDKEIDDKDEQMEEEEPSQLVKQVVSEQSEKEDEQDKKTGGQDEARSKKNEQTELLDEQPENMDVEESRNEEGKAAEKADQDVKEEEPANTCAVKEDDNKNVVKQETDQAAKKENETEDGQDEKKEIAGVTRKTEAAESDKKGNEYVEKPGKLENNSEDSKVEGEKEKQNELQLGEDDQKDEVSPPPNDQIVKDAPGSGSQIFMKIVDESVQSDEEVAPAKQNEISIEPVNEDDDSDSEMSEPDVAEVKNGEAQKKDAEPAKQPKDVTGDQTDTSKEKPVARTTIFVDLEDEEEEDEDHSKEGAASAATKEGRQRNSSGDAVTYEQALGELKRIEEGHKRILEEEPAASPSKRPAETSGVGGEPVAKRRRPDEDAEARKKIKKQLKTISRQQLEELVAAKMVEAVANRTEIGQLRRQVDAFASTVEFWRNRAAAFTKQCSDLHTVMKKFVIDSKVAKGTGRSVVPVRITRSVGLQVLPPERRGQLRVTGPPTGARGGGRGGGVQRGGAVLQNPRGGGAGGVVHNVPPANSRAPVAAGRGVANSSVSPRANAVSPNPAMAVRPLASLVSAPVASNRPPAPAAAEAQAAPAPPPARANPEIVELDLSDDETTDAVPAPPSQNSNRSPGIAAQPPAQPISNGVSPRNAVVATGGSRVFTVRPAGGVGALRQNVAGPAVQQQRGVVPVNRPALFRLAHPAPLPPIPNPQPMGAGWRMIPPKPTLKIQRVDQGIVLSWTMNQNLRDHDTIASYHLYAYQEQAAAMRIDSSLWKKVGDVKALPLPMACTLTQFSRGNKYHFAVRASDTHGRYGPFSDPASILLN